MIVDSCDEIKAESDFIDLQGHFRGDRKSKSNPLQSLSSNNLQTGATDGLRRDRHPSRKESDRTVVISIIGHQQRKLRFFRSILRIDGEGIVLYIYLYKLEVNNMTKSMNISDARAQLLHIADEFAEHPGTVEVTRHGKPVMVLLPAEVYESMRETMEITADERLMTSIERGLDDARAKRSCSLRSVRKQLKI